MGVCKMLLSLPLLTNGTLPWGVFFPKGTHVTGIAWKGEDLLELTCEGDVPDGMLTRKGAHVYETPTYERHADGSVSAEWPGRPHTRRTVSA